MDESTESAADPPVRVASRTATEADSIENSGDAGEGPHEVTIRGFRFQVPAGWKQVALSAEQQGMIDARFEIPEAGPDVKLTLSTVGGGVESNVERWLTQFDLREEPAPRPETFEVDGIQVTWVDLAGTYHGMGGEYQPGWRMLGAAFHGEPDDFYIKLTGPAATVGEISAQFRTFVESARRE
jgi:hypothetical protein